MQTWAAVMMKEVPTRFLNWRQIWTHLGGAGINRCLCANLKLVSAYCLIFLDEWKYTFLAKTYRGKETSYEPHCKVVFFAHLWSPAEESRVIPD